MKYNIRLIIVVIFILLVLQTSYADSQLQIQDPDTDDLFSFAEIGDVDGDGKDDLVFIHGNNGTLSTGVSLSHDNNYDNHILYDEAVWHGNIGSQLFLEDVDGDRADDMVFVLQEDTSSLVTVFISNGDGTFRDAQTQEVKLDCSDHYYSLGGDVDGDQRFDLIFNIVTPNKSDIQTLIAFGQSDGLFNTAAHTKHRN